MYCLLYVVVSAVEVVAAVAGPVVDDVLSVVAVSVGAVPVVAVLIVAVPVVAVPGIALPVVAAAVKVFRKRS